MTTMVEGAAHDEKAASLRLGAHIRLLRHAGDRKSVV